MSEKIFAYELGEKVKDTITGYEGTIIGRTQWLYGCKRYCIQSAKLKDDGSPVDAYTTDEGALEPLERKEPTPAPKKPGGPRPKVARRPDPRR